MHFNRISYYVSKEFLWEIDACFQGDMFSIIIIFVLIHCSSGPTLDFDKNIFLDDKFQNFYLPVMLYTKYFQE